MFSKRQFFSFFSLASYVGASGLMLYAYDPKDPDTIAALDAAVEAAVDKLALKNKELLSELKKAKKGAEIDPQTVADLETQVEKLQGELTAAQKATKDALKAAETATAQLGDESKFTQQLLIDNGLTAALVEAGVKNPAQLKAVTAMMRGSVAIKVEGAARKAVVGDKELVAYVKEWSLSDEGKQFVAAPQNSGGGSKGSGAGGGGQDLSKLSPVERINAARAAQT